MKGWDFSNMQVVFQQDTMQCGIACLKMICQYFGKKVSLSFLSKMCSSTNEGTSLLSISETASIIGLKSACYKLSLSELNKIHTPCILHWNQNHFVVLYQ
jgi:ATP-binding cassette subfamily B protein